MGRNGGLVVQVELGVFFLAFIGALCSIACLPNQKAFSIRYELLQYFRGIMLSGTSLLLLTERAGPESVLFVCASSLYLPFTLFYAAWLKAQRRRVSNPNARAEDAEADGKIVAPPAYAIVEALPPSYTDCLRMYPHLNPHSHSPASPSSPSTSSSSTPSAASTPSSSTSPAPSSPSPNVFVVSESYAQHIKAPQL